MDLAYYGKKLFKKIFNSIKDTSPSTAKNNSDPAQELIKISLDTTPLFLSSPVVLCGSVISDKPTFNTLTNFGAVSLHGAGPVILISTDSKNYTNIGIREHNQFSIGIPDESMVKKVNYCGTVSGHQTDKSGVFKVQYGTLEHAPLVTESLFAFACKVIDHATVDSMDVFFGEIVEKYAQSDVATDEDKNCYKPLCYGPGAKYGVVDSKVGTPWSDYRKYK